MLEVDIADFFPSLDHGLLEKLQAERSSDRRMVKLVRKRLGVGVIEEGRFREAVTGTPQGGVISPLLSNYYLHPLDSIPRSASPGHPPRRGCRHL